MILIADSGSTKTDWALTDPATKSTVRTFSGPGLNPAVMSADEFDGLLAEGLDGLRLTPDDEVHFYGAGCLPELCGRVAGSIGKLTGATRVEVSTDMLGAVRALFGNDPGIAAILGTGSNSCYYDGTAIVANTPPLGYILGDEGSGARLGIALVSGVFKGCLPADVSEAFARETGLTKGDVIERVYRRPGANTFLASLTRFLSAHIDHPAIDALVTDEFSRFFERNVIGAYPPGIAAGFVGSLAEVFATQLHKAADGCGIGIARILPRPLEALADYHIANHHSNITSL